MEEMRSKTKLLTPAEKEIWSYSFFKYNQYFCKYIYADRLEHMTISKDALVFHTRFLKRKLKLFAP